MFQKEELKRISPLLFFFLGYSILFVLWVKTFFYTLPFILGFLLALAVSPLIRFLDGKLHWKHNISASTATFLLVILLTGALGALLFFLVNQAVQLASQAATGGFPEFTPQVNAFLKRIGTFFSQFDPEFFENNRQEILAWLQSSADLVLSLLKGVLAAVTSIPTALTLFLVTGVSSYFLARDLTKIKAWATRIFSTNAVSQGKKVVRSWGKKGKKTIGSYFFLYFITFCETVVFLSILRVPYALLLGLATSVADVLPVLGPGFVLLPLSVYQVLTGQYAKALGVLLGWLIITLLRQLTEPKLVSSTTKIHPLVMLAAIYFSLVGGSFWIFLYVLGLFSLYTALREAGALPKLGVKSDPSKEETRSP